MNYAAFAEVASYLAMAGSVLVLPRSERWQLVGFLLFSTANFGWIAYGLGTHQPPLVRQHAFFLLTAAAGVLLRTRSGARRCKRSRARRGIGSRRPRSRSCSVAC